MPSTPSTHEAAATARAASAAPAADAARVERPRPGAKRPPKPAAGATQVQPDGR